MLAYKSLCPSAWTSRWDDQRGECTRRAIPDCRNSRACYRICRIANIRPRERQLPRKAGPVNSSPRRSLARNLFFRAGEYHSDRYQQCSSGSRTPRRLHTQVRDVNEFTLDRCCSVKRGSTDYENSAGSRLQMSRYNVSV
jgi:hypothetical protein